MGKKLSKSELLFEIEVEKNKLENAIESLTDEQMTEPGVTPGGWSVKDILGHLIEWQKLNVYWYRADKRGEKPAVPSEGISWRETSKLNHLIFIEHKDDNLALVKRNFAASHHAMLELIAEVEDDEFVTVGRFSWCGNSWCLSDYVRANTASHYRWASEHITKWQKKRSTQQ